MLSEEANKRCECELISHIGWKRCKSIDFLHAMRRKEIAQSIVAIHATSRHRGINIKADKKWNR